jgi:hypothetical protein
MSFFPAYNEKQKKAMETPDQGMKENTPGGDSGFVFLVQVAVQGHRGAGTLNFSLALTSGPHSFPTTIRVTVEGLR